MVSRMRVREVVRAGPPETKGKLLSFLGRVDDLELAKWDLDDTDEDQTIYDFTFDRAQGSLPAEMASTVLKRVEFVMDVMLMGLKQTFRPPSSGKESRGSNKGFRQHVAWFYGLDPCSDKMKCMVLDEALPSGFLVAGHLFAVRWQPYANVVMGKDFNVESPKNGIIWNSAIEHEYERQHICFSYGGVGSEFILHVLDKSLLPVKLSSVGQHKNDQTFAKVLDGITFGDLHNKRVNFAAADGKGPFKRALALHAKVALEHCAKTYPNGFDPENYLFDDVSEHEGKDRVAMWLRKLDTGLVDEEAESLDPVEVVDDEEDDG